MSSPTCPFCGEQDADHGEFGYGCVTPENPPPTVTSNWDRVELILDHDAPPAVTPGEPCECGWCADCAKRFNARNFPASTSRHGGPPMTLDEVAAAERPDVHERASTPCTEHCDVAVHVPTGEPCKTCGGEGVIRREPRGRRPCPDCFPGPTIASAASHPPATPTVPEDGGVLDRVLAPIKADRARLRTELAEARDDADQQAMNARNMQSERDAARTELATARREYDEAARAHQDALNVVSAELATARGLLAEVEWEADGEGGVFCPICRACGSGARIAHDIGCRLAAFLGPPPPTIDSSSKEPTESEAMNPTYGRGAAVP